MACSPVVIFAYNRQPHLQATVEALAANELAAQTDVIVYSDGPKNSEDQSEVQAVRSYLRNINGFRSLTIRVRETNWGLADSIVDGVTRVIKDYNQVIVLEDDILTSPVFLRYMNDSLSHYADESMVMHIAGHMLDICQEGLPEAFFLRQSSCWGWGTWARAWQHFCRAPKNLLRSFTSTDIQRFNLDGAFNYWDQVQANARGILKTWAVFWYAVIFQQNGLCLHPRSSLIKNIGFDGTGTNCGDDGGGKFITSWGTATAVKKFPAIMQEHGLAMSRYQDHLLGSQAYTLPPSLRTKWSSAVRLKLATLIGRSKK
jgi:hypothetical protein